MRARLEELDLSAALETAWTFVRRLNRYVEEQAPWKLAKAAMAEAAAPSPTTDGGSSAALDGTLWDLAEGLRLLSVILYPFIPETAAAIRDEHRSAALLRRSGLGSALRCIPELG